jgi:nucleoside-diphosphate-sugar epimerase
MKILIGNTGFVGKNLKQQKFDFEFNSKNIEDIVDCPDECDLYLSCLPATKWMVNQNIQKDYKNIQNIISIISKKKYGNIYLFSTIDVYGDSPLKVDEDYFPNFSGLTYGSNRLLFEYLVRELVDYKNFYTFRLPALFGKFLKKNVIYDLLTNNRVEHININSYYQWYNLENLIGDIDNLTLNNKNASIFNLFNEPIYTEELVKHIFPEFELKLKGDLIKYNYITKYSSTGYLYSKNEVLDQLKKFVYEIRN